MRCIPISLPSCSSFNFEEVTPCKVTAVVSGTLFTLSSLAMFGLLLAHSPITSTFIWAQATTFTVFSAALLAEYCRHRNSNAHEPVIVVLDELSSKNNVAEEESSESQKSSSKKNELDNSQDPEGIEKSTKEENVTETSPTDVTIPDKEPLLELFIKHKILTLNPSARKHWVKIDPKTEEELIKEFETLRSYGYQESGSPPKGLIAAQDLNFAKLRYMNIYPYDENVYKYQIENEKERFINASVLCTGDIVTQGPLPDTIEDFWSMVWDAERSREEEILIVMMTDLVEDLRTKCEKYWPDDKKVFHLEKIDMTIETTEIKERKSVELSLRTFKVTHNGEERTVNQIHIQNWKDHEGTPLVRLGGIIETLNKEEARKMRKILHCSAGVGRTMTFVACEMLYNLKKQLEAYGVSESYKLDLVELVKFLRLPPDGRINAIMSPDLYLLLYAFAISQFPLDAEKKSLDQTDLLESSWFEI